MVYNMGMETVKKGDAMFGLPLYMDKNVVVMARGEFDEIVRSHDDARLRAMIERIEEKQRDGTAVFHDADEFFKRFEEAHGIKI